MTIYVFDTGSLITLFRPGSYDKAVFPTLWKNFDRLVATAPCIPNACEEYAVDCTDSEWVHAKREVAVLSTLRAGSSVLPAVM